MTHKILVVEDEPEMQFMLRDNLRYEGYDILSAETGERGIEIGLSERPDLVILDVVLPKMSGYAVCQSLRKAGFRAPIIMLTARNAEVDRVRGLDIGADDYIGKPFGVSELMARIRAHLRRLDRADMQPGELAFGRIVIDEVRRQAFRDQAPLDLSTHEFGLLLYLVRHEGETISREQLLKDVWGYPETPLTRTIDNFIARLRSKIEDRPHQPRHILTVHGSGYRFVK